MPQLLRFGVVGLTATAIHAAIYALACGHGLTPLAANFAGFLVAFSVSFAGHRWWTFAREAANAHASLAKFFVTAVLGLGSNTGLTWLLVMHWRLPAQSALIGILLVTPALVFVASKYWAFAAPP